MPKQAQKKRTTQSKSKGGVDLLQITTGGAKQHNKLVNDLVHVFVDDQNLFWGIVNNDRGIAFRIDFGRLLLAAARDAQGQPRGVQSAFIAGVVPDDDSFWEAAKSRGFTVKRGYLGHNNRSKQDDAYLITEVVSTLYEEAGPSTVVVVAGDADYVPPLELAVKKGWRTEVAFVNRGVSTALVPVVHGFRRIAVGDIQRYTD